VCPLFLSAHDHSDPKPYTPRARDHSGDVLRYGVHRDTNLSIDCGVNFLAGVQKSSGHHKSPINTRGLAIALDFTLIHAL
jgi:hypothetical protein